MNKVYGDTCIWCSSPCVTTLFNTSEDCSNPKCRAYIPPGIKNFNTETQREAADLLDKLDVSGVQTGRLQSAEPNPSSLPRTDEPKKDWKQELRELAKRPSFSTVIEVIRTRGMKLDPELLKKLGVSEEDAKKMLEAYKRSRDFGAIYGRGPEELVDAILKADPIVTGHTSIGHVFSESDKLREYAKTDAKATRRAWCEREMEKRNTYMNNRLRWPRTMRVMKREVNDNSFDKKNQQMLGVLSFVDSPYLPHKPANGLTAFYDYITVAEPAGGRCRVQVRRHTDKEGVVHLDDGYLTRSSGSMIVLLRGHENVDRQQLLDVHLGAIAREFDLDIQRDRAPRRMDVMENYFSYTIKELR